MQCKDNLFHPERLREIPEWEPGMGVSQNGTQKGSAPDDRPARCLLNS
jgi:hypothetical protein